MKQIIVAVLALFGVMTFSVHAQFNPKAVATGGARAVAGGATDLDIRQTGPGKARFVTKMVNAVYLSGEGGAPQGVQPQFTKDDASGKGQASVASVATNARAFANSRFCWRGVGADWETIKCGPLNAEGTATVDIDVGAARDAAFALVPVIYDASNKMTWAAHPEDAKRMLSCPSMGAGHQDMASVFTVTPQGTIRPATADETARYARSTYSKICQRNT